MLVRFAIAGFLLAHAGIHASFLSPRPAVTAGGPAWPFELDRSWLLRAFGVDPEIARFLGIALVAVTIGGFGLAAIAALGVVPALWVPAVMVGSAASIALLVVFFHPWLVLGVAIDLVLIWATMVARWLPEGVAFTP